MFGLGDAIASLTGGGSLPLVILVLGALELAPYAF